MTSPRIYSRARPILDILCSTRWVPGDTLYTLQSESRITTSVLMATSGTGTVFREISPGMDAAVPNSFQKGNGILQNAGLIILEGDFFLSLRAI